ncbi:MAG TPA: UDP-N-acetylmuramoyl-L-alanyl-D-glutamate--2,6-diaminopimelate ligase [Polyangiaceae bacterium]|nr:UDP-N-acetylmuramoyl-L-alanyl-D-glutamate--2,6-diaminopimelate ligase [Polyangiaceae bacterium]
MPLSVTGLSLSDLVVELGRVKARLASGRDVSVTDVRHDSRQVEPGDLFVARQGGKLDGARFVGDAVARGAIAVLAAEETPLPDLAVPVLRVSDVRLALALAAEAVHGHPTRKLGVVGITGTNGKTTTSFLVAEAIDATGAAAGRLGTLGYAFGGDIVDESLTTPEADDVSRFAARALARGATHLAMEVSSIALTQARVDAVSFAVAALTNVTQDHLDYHGSMDAYAKAKARLFDELAPRVAVINVDDPVGAAIAERTQGTVLRVGRDSDADVRPLAVRVTGRGIHGDVKLPSGTVKLASPLVGAHNLDNLLLTLAIVEAFGLDVVKAAAGLGRAGSAPGRLERCSDDTDDITVLVDYAHTPDALRRVLEAVSGLTHGAVHCVFGCGGDRDPKKRAKMGEAAGAAATRITITNDNPRSEDPAAIAASVELGLWGSGVPYEIILDRHTAIEKAILSAEPGDLVLLAGKGHEPYQIIGAEKRAFDDRVEARRALALRRGKKS